MGRKWNNIKMKKAATDKLRSQNYTKVLREVTMAVKKAGHAEVDANFALKIALLKAREYNVPKDNVDKAIKKGLGNDGAVIEEINYEGYALDGVAVFMEAATDNPTRTVGNIRSYFNKWGGGIGTQGCLQFVFEHKATFVIKQEDLGLSTDDLMMELIDFGIDDVESEEGFVTVKGPVDSYGDIYKKLEELKIKVEESGLDRLPLNTKEVSKESYEKIQRLLDVLDGDDDILKVYHNMEWHESFAD
ncbi:MAG TPA: YebC/PmpR family DNA-binding transcriptional regulator [Bacteriovoracaceae bacterium]|nr:YebC/PmpR family DNA-binding transcriptional regulator [Bacteriovoracaceae bacterium]